MPFKVQEIQEKGGMYFGENAISRNLLLCNKQNLQNHATVVFGVPGSGKSFLTKEQIFMLIANTDDDILICDLAGHENSKITMDIYAKVKYNQPHQLSAVVNSAFG